LAIQMAALGTIARDWLFKGVAWAGFAAKALRLPYRGGYGKIAALFPLRWRARAIEHINKKEKR
jgi:hypothetical protein